MASSPPQLTWPAAQIPVEIFDEITTYLSRADAKNLRLVNHEFDRMVSAKYFRNVVVPFRAELYKGRQLNATRSENGDEDQVTDGKDTLFSSGMRIFQSFGEHILRFALSLELDEETLAYPPIKPTQKAITSYWGIYRWPHESYLRYSELEGLEQTADETASMKEAMRCLTKVQELGLCCDAGLGYLLGPDRQVESPATPHPVFGLRNLRYRSLQKRLSRVDPEAINARKLAFESPRDFKYTVLENMVKTAGYTQEQARDAIEMLLSTENVSLMNIDFDERTTAGANAEAIAMAAHAFVGNDDRDQEEAIIQRTVSSVMGESSLSQPLQPRNLTRAQKEMLLELEWAHRALIQSYVIALIDNTLTNSFSSLTTLTIAKIPSSHIFMFQRSDFWKSLPNLTNVALAVIADWRQVAKVAPGCVEDSLVSPVGAVTRAHRLLVDHIAKQANIKFLHFEWICGGEFAPGITQRNQFVLPAPFCLPAQMVQPDTAKAPDVLLSLPHVKHLSLKNCYFTPNVLLQVLRTMALQSLKKLELETVSLTGPPARDQFLPPMAVLLQAQAQAQQQQVQNQPVLAAQIQAHHAQHAQQMQQAATQAQQLTQAAQLVHPPPLPPAPLQPQAIPVVLPPPAVAPALGPQLQPIHIPVNGNAAANATPNVGQFGPQLTQAIQAAIQQMTAESSSESASIRLRLTQPRLLSWTGILDRLAPVPGVQDLISQQTDQAGAADDAGEEDEEWLHDFVRKDDGFSYIPSPRTLIMEKNRFGIEQMSFKSCGYVTIDLALFDIHDIVPLTSPWHDSQEHLARRREILPFMQTCTDRLAGKVVNHLSPPEQFNLSTAYGMDTTWVGLYDDDIIEAARRDGIQQPGLGRFSGTITKAAAEP
ncbi:hypothetical protein CCHL11_01192 [Colletotrichum chlorophyti]|uniref:F-box domain-containing protein n=1 Tax=Colletotrichum chlorophyti TaxID=708187 RepID=A0A1Q8S7S0_9PEZI|nr:hypothetical protein CCHL11_01192 [Colletotrichum chlorophyti]